MSKEQYDAGWLAGYNFVLSNPFHIGTVGYKMVDDKKVYSGTTNNITSAQFRHSVYSNGAGYGNGFAEGMISGRWEMTRRLLPGLCDKLGIEFVDYEAKYKNQP